MEGILNFQSNAISNGLNSMHCILLFLCFRRLFTSCFQSPIIWNLFFLENRYFLSFNVGIHLQLKTLNPIIIFTKVMKLFIRGDDSNLNSLLFANVGRVFDEFFLNILEWKCLPFQEPIEVKPARSRFCPTLI